MISTTIIALAILTPITMELILSITMIILFRTVTIPSSTYSTATTTTTTRTMSIIMTSATSMPKLFMMPFNILTIHMSQQVIITIIRLIKMASAMAMVTHTNTSI